jgi:hypothetical protein
MRMWQSSLTGRDRCSPSLSLDGSVRGKVISFKILFLLEAHDQTACQSQRNTFEYRQRAVRSICFSHDSVIEEDLLVTISAEGESHRKTTTLENDLILGADDNLFHLQ